MARRTFRCHFCATYPVSNTATFSQHDHDNKTTRPAVTTTLSAHQLQCAHQRHTIETQIRHSRYHMVLEEESLPVDHFGARSVSPQSLEPRISSTVRTLKRITSGSGRYAERCPRQFCTRPLSISGEYLKGRDGLAIANERCLR